MPRRALFCSVLVVLALGFASPGASANTGPPGNSQGTLAIYYTPPVLVRAGEPVRIPVDVVCATAEGTSCRAIITVAARTGFEDWHVGSAAARTDLSVDMSAMASRALSSPGSGSVSFSLRAQAASGQTVSLPPSPDAVPLRFYVVRSLPAVAVPPTVFGEVRRARTVLFLPWGTGALRAGLSLGTEAATIGPQAFDVDREGRIYLLDAVQRRVAVFDRGSLLHQTGLSSAAAHDIAVTADGTAFVLSTTSGSDDLMVQSIQPNGTADSLLSVGKGIPSEIRTAGSRAYVHELPLDAWVPVPARSGLASGAATGRVSVGRPLDGDGQLIRVVSGNALRLGVVSGDAVGDALALTFSQRLGEVALTERDGRVGYWVVMHICTPDPSPADQYQIVHVLPDRSVETFAAASDHFAEAAALSRFRLGKDGGLYQLMTSSDGMRIVRYDFGRVS